MIELRISELSRRSGTSIATIKYYIREGLIPPGERVNARVSNHNDATVDRLRLITGLIHVVGLSMSQVRQVLDIIDEAELRPAEAMTRATVDLPLSGRGPLGASHKDPPNQTSHSFDQALAAVGFEDIPDAEYVRQTKAAMALAERCGVGIQPDHLLEYASAARKAAQADFAQLPLDAPRRAVQAAVLGTAIYEPVLLGLRRLAHRELARQLNARLAQHYTREEEGPDHGR
ncbi:MAG: MerR family transcriptional regulator [Bifidobacteriaceae bacterium]|nr:MerR family transcriptional regulator [Bifidobacteriaceae bacterium]